ncbi:hypothetical protein GGI25_000618 [Coemansia spiralis]|uniref:Lysozyme n=2 Tax=Coemansia TaxID=4863 RepID=A0A9W8L112_9FUNG|nr:lysozyme-like domain-containing protein [Coemansia spiralis]KAJ1996075.1 hypothetical protein EDC05_000443 [Coemansia umbellata]KAJ2625518.1 hypothetical protein GGI26_000658 [Coemansia sp. RSA 1358]KAJ2680645.1 hypothetical protein GGI25_000618 [Coemansia spiralis]
MKLATLATAIAFALSSLTLAANGYTVKDSLHCRSGPGTGYAIIKIYKKGTNISISCQTPGTNVLGDTLWDKTSDGCYVSDYYVLTGTSSYVTRKCPSKYCVEINQRGIDLITEFEGFVANPSPDATGLPTVGYGHQCQTKGCGEAKYKFPLTKATARELLVNDIPSYTKCLGSCLNNVSLNQNQWAALTSWVFNVGCGSAESSSLVKRLNSGESPNTVAAQELPKWQLAGGKVLPGLVRRRAAEIKLFTTASSKKAYPACQ